MYIFFHGILVSLFLCSTAILNAQSWTNKSAYPGTAIDDGIGFSINGTGYVGTGIANVAIFQNTFYRYDVQADTWSQISSIIGDDRQYCSSFVVDG
jgi:N-acetylneuraminic acid mutarotase